MASYSFTVPGTPTGKQRPRVNRKTSNVYTPTQTVNFEAVVRATAINAGVKPIEGPVGLSVEVSKAPAKSWSKKKQREAVDGVWAQAKPDLDNVVKAIADALSNGVAFKDDTQIAFIDANRIWGDEDKTVVTIRSI